MKKILNISMKAFVATSLAAGAIALVAISPTISGTNTANVSPTVNDTKYNYEPITISSGYNANVISYSKTADDPTGWQSIQAVDDNHLRSNQTEIETGSVNGASLFINSTAGGTVSTSYPGLPDPVDGFVTIPSASTSTTGGKMKWKVPVGKATANNNALKLYVNNNSGEGGSLKTGKFTFSDFGVYNKLYVLCVLAGNNTTSAKVTVSLNYTDGTSDSEQYTIYDWFKGYETAKTKGVYATSAYSRVFFWGNKTSQTVEWDSGAKENEVIFNQLGVNVDKSKIVKDLSITLNSTNNGDVLTCFGVTGEVTADVLAPVSIKTHKERDASDNPHNYVTWDKPSASETTKPSYYYLDVYHYDDNGDAVFETKYNSKEITYAEAEAADFKWEIDQDINPDDPDRLQRKYIVRMRAGNADRVQTANSNEDYIYIDEGIPKRVDCVPNTTDNSGKIKLHVGLNSAAIKTTVWNDLATPVECADQGIIWEIPDKYKDTIVITENTNSNSLYKLWDVEAKKPLTIPEGGLVAKSHAQLNQSDSVGGDSKPNAPSPKHESVKNKSAVVKWTNPEIGSATASKHTFNLEVSKEDGTKVIEKTGIAWNNSGTTSVSCTDLEPKTKYKVKVQTVYTSSTTNETFTSDWSSEDEFTTSWNAAKTLNLSSSTVNLMLGKTDTTQTITTTIKDSSGNNATFQDVTWSGDESFAKVTSDTPVQETATSHTFKPVAPTSTAQKWTATVKETTSSPITATVNVTVGVSPTDVADPTKIKPNGFIANWSEAKRADNTHWATGYVVKLYDSSSKVVDTKTITDPTITSCEFTGLVHNATYSYTVTTVNGTVSSTASSAKTVKTEISHPTLLEVYNGETKLEGNVAYINTLVGAKIALNSKVYGETFDGEYFEADDKQVVTKNLPADGIATVTDSADKTVHTIETKKVGGTAFDLATTSETRATEPKSLVQTVVVNVKPMVLGTTSTDGASKLKIAWDDLSSYKADPAKQLDYIIEVSTSDFSAGSTIVKTITDGSTQTVIDNLTGETTYYIRAKYSYNGVESAYTTVQTITTDKSITDFSLSKSSLGVIGNTSDTSLVGTMEASSTLPVEWELSDKNICSVEQIEYTDENGTSYSRFKITGLKVGKTVLSVWPKDNKKDFTRTCAITVVKGELDPIVAWADDITNNSFNLKWNGINDWFGNSVSYRVNVWSLDGNGTKIYVLQDYVTDKPNLVLDGKKNIVTNTTYYCTVDAFNDKFQTNSCNIVKVVLNTPFPWWKVWSIIGGTIGGLILVPILLYILWKNSIIRTIDPRKAKFKLSNKKNNIFDKAFRVLDMYYVMWAQIITKKFGTLFTKLGTKKEHLIEKEEQKNKKK